jgi:hypothetical protein
MTIKSQKIVVTRKPTQNSDQNSGEDGALVKTASTKFFIFKYYASGCVEIIVNQSVTPTVTYVKPTTRLKVQCLNDFDTLVNHQSAIDNKFCEFIAFVDDVNSQELYVKG